MPGMERYDAVVIGSGEEGKYLAWHLAHAGGRVAVVERRWGGGSCPNINRLPGKNEIASAAVARIVARAGAFGPVSVDMRQVLRWRQARDRGAFGPENAPARAGVSSAARRRGPGGR
jgi:pyruvate/2-oxoglutarate dehydrogenase complex dihydrolipoamide dehydrogenase (E3) component